MKNILVLTDFSENSVNAYRYAVELACQIKANILLVFSTNGKSISLTNQMEYSQMLHSFAKRHACAARMRANPHHTECLISGDAWTDAIPLLIQVHKPDMVVSGSDLLAQFEKDQVTLSLANFEKCPMLWVPEKTIYQPLKNLAFVTDFTDLDADVILHVKRLAEEFNAEVSLIHFYPKIDGSRFAEINRKAAELQLIFDRIKTSYSLIEEEDMIEGLEDLAQKQVVNMFILATRDTHLAHHYFQPVYRKTNSCQTEIPLLNFYQEQKKACAGNCEFCHEVEKANTVAEV